MVGGLVILCPERFPTSLLCSYIYLASLFLSLSKKIFGFHNVWSMQHPLMLLYDIQSVKETINVQKIPWGKEINSENDTITLKWKKRFNCFGFFLPRGYMLFCSLFTLDVDGDFLASILWFFFFVML